MDFAKKVPGFIYLDKNGFYFFESGLNTVLSLAFTTASVKDMDVLNRSALNDQIQGFIAQYKITPSNFFIVLSPNITFEKDIVGQNQETTKMEIEKFLETVPFESVISREYPIEKGTKIIASNDDLYREIKAGFEKNSSTVSAVVPFQMLGQEQSLIRNLTTDNASELLKKADKFKQSSLVNLAKDKPQVAIAKETKNDNPTNKNNTRLFGMIGVFVVLFLVLGVMILNM